MKRFDMSSIHSMSILIIILIVAGCAEIHRPTFDAEANFNRATAHVKEGRVDRAIPDYTKTKEINPRDANQYVNRGLAYSEKGQ
ncbi:MAG: tetratricopeptide repeat protein, partial [Desulfobacterales bacterium]